MLCTYVNSIARPSLFNWCRYVCLFKRFSIDNYTSSLKISREHFKFTLYFKILSRYYVFNGIILVLLYSIVHYLILLIRYWFCHLNNAKFKLNLNFCNFMNLLNNNISIFRFWVDLPMNMYWFYNNVCVFLSFIAFNECFDFQLWRWFLV